jgi:hypothetical protein
VGYDQRDGNSQGTGDAGPEVAAAAKPRPGDGAVRMAAAVVLLGGAWRVVALPPFSGGATVVVVGAGVVAMVAGWWERRRGRAPAAGGGDDGAGVASWVVLALVAGAWQLASYLQHPRTDHPTLSSLTNALLDSHVTRAAAFVLWLVAARGLARR